VRRIPVYPAAGGYALPEDVALLASNESPYPPIPAVVDAVAPCWADSTAIPTDERRTAPAR
jgi:histidinol-phosphate aminotransferase